MSEDFYQNCKESAMKYYLKFVNKDANNEPFDIPEYEWFVNKYPAMRG